MGLGDEIMALGRAQKLAANIGRPVAITDRAGNARSHPIWHGQPEIDPDSDDKLIDCPGARMYISSWGPGPRIHYNRNFRVMDHPATLKLPRRRIRVHSETILVNPAVKPGASRGKDWGFHRWAEVAEFIPGKYRIVQIGEKPPPALVPEADYISTPTVWDAADVISQCALVLTPEGGIHHLAGALRIPAVVVFGGFIHPDTTGYDWHHNLFVGDRACGEFNACRHCGDALASITPVKVTQAMFRALREIEHG